MATKYIRDYCPSATYVMKALLPNYHVDFRRYSTDMQGGISSIMEAPGDQVEGIVYDIAQKEIEDLNIDAQFELQKYQKKGNELQQDLMREMTPKLQAVLTDLIEVEGYDVVMPRAGLLYTNAKHNITRKVTEKLNEKQ